MKSRYVIFRLPLVEYHQLLAIAAHDEETVSDLVRSALYRCYERRGLGRVSIHPQAVSPARVCDTPAQ